MKISIKITSPKIVGRIRFISLRLLIDPLPLSYTAQIVVSRATLSLRGSLDVQILLRDQRLGLADCCFFGYLIIKSFVIFFL